MVTFGLIQSVGLLWLLGLIATSGLATPTPFSRVHLDHMVYVVDDLEKAMADWEVLTGVRPALGGKHAGLGTHNALLSLNDGACYIELFAADPDNVPAKTIIGVDSPVKPKLTTFCVGCKAEPSIDNILADLQTSTEPSLFSPAAEHGSRVNAADGKLIEWKVAVDRHTVPYDQLPMQGLVPFFIYWQDPTLRPAATAPRGCNLVKLTAFHPEPERLRALYDRIGGMNEFVEVCQGDEPRLVALLETPNGTVEIS